MAASTPDNQRVRLDKWLWAVRLYKTRSLAKEAVEGGKVRYNSQRCKPGRLVELGATLTLRLGWQEQIIVVDDISERRRGAPEAQMLYHETEDSVKKREDLARQRKTMQASQLTPARRPSKKDRRDLQRFRDQNGI
ncbi:heat shock protein Hsp15 [Marinobacter sp. LV10R510-11A]|uniref:ribosome-associated heat shock protein Hsp15 n=1 Tax=Marinobacter sp. LV10R510-11A TaxID=1415568 RepID=UPI000BB6B227|nr:ribosome-associated heat shock protein Hsp15 [Marinobacter sp. LV10R510-11A]SOB77570.1 heat shock protein Hsp15 [Marinobacter sp. LV10R510-11A]